MHGMYFGDESPGVWLIEKAADVSSGSIRTKVSTSLVIFCISLFAVSFPALSKRTKYVKIPSIVFFLGKHFGTGVILSTAFVHLLGDAFKSLKSEWTGLIVLASLLAIFLVEYLSTAYVDHLHSYPSAPSTPKPSGTPSSSRTNSISTERTPRTSPQFDHCKVSPPLPSVESVLPEDGAPRIQPDGVAGETTPLSAPSPQLKSYGTHQASATGEDSQLIVAFPQHSCQAESAGGDSQAFILHRTTPHDPAHDQETRCCCCKAKIVSAHELGKDDAIFGGGHHRHESRSMHANHCERSKKIAAVVLLEGGEPEEDERDVYEDEDEHRAHAHVPRHSHHSGHEHDHAHSHGHGHGHGHIDIERWAGQQDEEAIGDGEEDGLLEHEHHHGHVGHEEEVKIGRRRQIVGILMLQIGIMLHSLVIGLTLAITTGPEFTTLVTAILFHQLFEGLSLGIRIAALPLPSASAPTSSTSHIPFLKPTLATTFALTTPLGIALGLLAFSSSSHVDIGTDGLLKLQGVMSAMSAGMLIYAACVEMLAGDFVMDAHMWRSPLRRQVMALVSLAAGVGAMAVVGLWD